MKETLMEKRVLIVGMSPEPGGIETFLYRAVQGLSGRGLRFDVLTACNRCAYEEEFIRLGARVFHTARRGKRPIKSYSDRLRFFKEYGPLYDTVWLHLSSASDISAARLAKKYTCARIVCHSHSASFESRPGLIRAAHLYLHKKNRPALARLADVCAAVTAEAGAWLYGDIGDRLVLMPGGVSEESFRFDAGLRAAARRALCVKGTVIGHVGRLAPVKNQKFLLDVFAAFLKKHEDASLLIAGEGELLEELRAYAEQKGLSSAVRFLGFRSDVPALLQAFDVLLLPSLFEGFPLILAEAQAAALPSIASDKVPKAVALTRFLRFMPLNETPEAWAGAVEEALLWERDASGVKEALERAGLTEAASQKRLFALLYGEDRA